MKLATALMEAAEPSKVSELPLRVSEVSQSESVRATEVATVSSSSWPPVRFRWSSSIMAMRCVSRAF